MGIHRKQFKLWLLFLGVLLGSGSPFNGEQQLTSSKLCLRKEKFTNLVFYVQDLVGGDNRTVWEVAKTDLTDVLPSAFGLVSVMDNLVTVAPGVDSGEVGRIQGLIGLSDFREKAIFMLLNLVFTHGKYKGSGLSILGRNPLNDKVGEVPIVAGTGVFRMARGYAVTSTFYVDDLQQREVTEYNVVVAHIDEAITQAHGIPATATTGASKLIRVATRPAPRPRCQVMTTWMMRSSEGCGGSWKMLFVDNQFNIVPIKLI